VSSKILIVTASYYKQISTDLLKAAKTFLDSGSVVKVKHTVISVPGIFEIPVVISRNLKKYDGFIALGCVIKGETPHFDYISKSTFNALMKLAVESKKPIGNGIITSLNISQALARSATNGKKKNKATEASRAVLSVLGILKHDPK